MTALLGGYTGDNLALATKLMAILGASIAFNAVVLVTTAIMQAHGHANIPVITMFVGGAVKLGVAWLLTGNPDIAKFDTNKEHVSGWIKLCMEWLREQMNIKF